MGKTFLGGNENKGNIDLLSPHQSGFLSSSLGPEQQQSAGGAYSNFLQPYNTEGFQDLFQKSFVDPAQQALQRQVIPGLKEGFLGLDESGSGSLNRALAQSATDVSTGIGQNYMNFFNQQGQNKLHALSQMGGLTGINSFSPHIEGTEGILGPLITALGHVGSAYASGGATGVWSILSSLMGKGSI